MQLRADLYQVDGELMIQAEVPGLAPEEIELMISPERICISGTRLISDFEVGSHEAVSKIHRRERQRGPFFREIPLPLRVLSDGADASLKDGVLTVRLVIRRKQAEPKKLSVQSAAARLRLAQPVPS